MAEALTNAQVASAYARWAPVYDYAFALVMRAGRRAAAQAVNRIGGRALDVGVGTGLELPMFDAAIRLTGVDLSEPMLRMCSKRIQGERLAHVDGLVAMDAMRLGFRDETFDVAVSPYVLTVVPDPHRLLDELVRVVKRGGEVILVNHISAEKGPIAKIETWLDRRSAALGWRPLFPWSIVETWLAARDDVALLERRTLPPFRLFTLVRLKRL